MNGVWEHDPESWIYESDAVEEITGRAPIDAKEWVDAFVDAVARTPELATDRESMLCWFAGAIMTGHQRGATDVASAVAERERSEGNQENSRADRPTEERG